MRTFTNDEASLLLYLETRAVDDNGFCKTAGPNGLPGNMNEEDFAIAKRWNDEGFIEFKRTPSYVLMDESRNYMQHGLLHYVILSVEAHEEAATLRFKRATRGVLRLEKILDLGGGVSV